MLAPNNAKPVPSFESKSFRCPPALVVLVAALLATVSALPLYAQSTAGAESTDGRHVLIATPHEVDGQPVTSILIEDAHGAEIGHLPDGWSAEPDGNGFTLSGPPLEEDRGRFRLDIAEGSFWEGSAITLANDSGLSEDARLDPPSEYPEVEPESSSSVAIDAPAEAAVGELVRLEITDEDLVGIGEWTLEGMPIFSAGDSPYLQSRIPPSLRPGDYARIEFKDEFGLTAISDDEAILIVGSSGNEANNEPAITGCTPRVFAGRTACICGNFPTQELQNGLMLDGQPLTVGAASSKVVHVTIPEGTSPGKHTITGNGIEGSTEITVLVARGEIDLEKIQEGGSTPLRVIIEGTTDVLEVHLQNLNPDIIALEGGDDQVVTTTGGGSNSLERVVTGLSVGAFDVYFELAEDPCPCLEGDDVLIAEDNPTGPTRTRDPNDSDSTRTRPPWWPEDPDDDDPRDVPEVPVYGEEEDDSEDPLCCGFRGPLLVWPQTTDPMAQADPMVAPRHPAVAANQVHLATGSFFLNERDIKTDAVGIPFDLTRHYNSNVETMSGGFLGHRWDFVYNKRLVALGRDYSKGLRGQLAGTEKSVVMSFDGTGRVLRYEEQSSDFRTVLNFGAERPFRAFVTTYITPAGEFNELQRYVVEDPETHPFIGHNDIDKGESIFYVLREKNGVRYIYNCRGQLIHILARNDYASLPKSTTRVPVRYTLIYRGPRSPLTQNTTLSSIEDPSGHTWYVSTTDIDNGLINTNDDCFHITGTMPIPRLEKIIGTDTELEFVYKDNTPVLDKVMKTFKNSSDPELTTETLYVYTGEQLLTEVVAPKEAAGSKAPYIENKYRGNKIISQRLGGKDYATIGYAGNSVTVSMATGYKTTYNLQKQGDYTVIRSQITTDSNGSWTTSFQHNNDTQITRLTLPRGNAVEYEYDAANGKVTRGPMRNDFTAGVTYHNDLSKGNLLGIKRVPGSIPVGDGPEAITLKSEFEPLYNQLLKQVDARGNETTVTYSYTKQGNLGNATEIKRPDLTQPDGTTVTTEPVRFLYNDRGQLATEIQPGADSTRYAYDEEGFVTSITRTGSKETFTRDPFGLIRSWTGPDGTYNYVRDVRGLITKTVHDPYGFSNETRFEYDLNGNLVGSETDVEDNFGSHEQLVEGISAPPAESKFVRTVTFELDMLGRVVKETTTGKGDSQTIEREFDATGQVVATIEPSPAGGQVRTTFVYNGMGYLLSESKAGLQTTHSYDKNGNLLSTKIGQSDASRLYKYEYDPFDRLIADTNPLGTRTSLQLDENGNVVSQDVMGFSGSQNGSDTLLASSATFYNELDQKILSTHFVLDQANSTLDTRYFYNAQGLLERIVAPGNSTTSYQYDRAGRLVKTIDPVGNEVRTEFDANGYKTAVIEAEDEYTYNVNTRQWSSQRKEYKSSLTYDSIGRLIKSTTSGITAAYRYNSTGKKRVEASGGTGLTITSYDGLGRQAGITSGGRTQTFSYTSSGHLSEMKAPMLHQKWTYDTYGHEVSSVDVLTGAETTIKRDELGNPVEVRDANGTLTRSTFNKVGLPTNEDIIPPSTTVSKNGLSRSIVAGAFNTWRRYDGLGRLRYAQNGRYATTRSDAVRLDYDGVGRIVREIQIEGDKGQSIRRTYAPDNSWMDTRYPEMTGSDVVRRNFDALGRVTRVDLDGEMVASYAYSGADRIAGSSLRNGSVTLHTYDDNRRLTNVQVYADAGNFGRNPHIIWSSRATYDKHGRLITNFVADQGAMTSTETVYTLDDLGRRSKSVTTTRVSGANPSVSVSTLISSFNGNRPSAQAELLVDESGEKRNGIFARVQEFEYDKGRVAAVSTLARNKFEALPDELTTPSQLKEWIGGDGSFSDRQTFVYDSVGNLVADDANLYTYDSERRLIAVAQIPGNRPYNQTTVFQYDPLGRRVSVYPLRDRTPGGFVNFAPWNRSPVRYLYDGPNVVAEIVDPAQAAPTLLARYLPGARPGEKVRMDRRTNDDPTAAIHEYYFHAGFQGELALLTAGSGEPLYTSAPSAGSAGNPVAPPDELQQITNTTTRVPYLGWTTRIDGFAGTKYDEVSGRPIYDYRTSTTLAEAMDMAAYRESITAMQNRGALTLGVLTMGALAPGAAAVEGLISVGLNWYASSTTQAGYSLDEASEHFAQGVLSGGMGKLVPGGLGTLKDLAGNYAADFTSGLAFDVGWRGRAWDDAISDNIVGAAASTAVSGGIKLGVTGAGVGFKRARAAYNSRSQSSTVYASQTSGTPGSVKRDLSGVKENVFDAILEGKFRSMTDNAFQLEMLDLLRTGRAYHRFLYKMIMKRKLTVMWDRNMPDTRAGGWNPETPSTLYLNPNIIARNPRMSLQITSTIVHEATHALGGGEPAAFLAQGAFLHHWKHRAKKMSPTGYGNKAQFIMDPSYQGTLDAYMTSQKTKTIGPLIAMMNSKGYTPANEAYFMHSKFISKLHRHVIINGGWKKILNLDPALDRALNVYSGSAFGY